MSTKKTTSVIAGCQCEDCDSYGEVYMLECYACLDEDCPAFLMNPPDGFGCSMGVPRNVATARAA